MPRGTSACSELPLVGVRGGNPRRVSRGRRVVKVFLLTSHPVAPPWNSGDKNLARTLLMGDAGVEFTFVGDRHDPSPWPRQHQRLLLRSAAFAPSSIEKMRLLRHLVVAPPQVDVVHLIVTFQSGRLTPRVLGALPLLRNRRFIATCPAGDFHPLPLLRKASAVVALSARTARRLRDVGLDAVEHIKPGVDLQRFAPESLDTGWAQLGVGDGPFLLFAGHHDACGGLEQALAVTAQVRRRVPTVRLIAAMRHRPHEDGPALRRQLTAMAQGHGLDGAVVELGGLANMAAAIRASHAVLFQPARMGLKMELPLTL